MVTGMWVVRILGLDDDPEDGRRLGTSRRNWEVGERAQ